MRASIEEPWSSGMGFIITVPAAWVRGSIDSRDSQQGVQRACLLAVATVAACCTCYSNVIMESTLLLSPREQLLAWRVAAEMRWHMQNFSRWWMRQVLEEFTAVVIVAIAGDCRMVFIATVVAWLGQLPGWFGCFQTTDILRLRWYTFVQLPISLNQLGFTITTAAVVIVLIIRCFAAVAVIVVIITTIIIIIVRIHWLVGSKLHWNCFAAIAQRLVRPKVLSGHSRLLVPLKGSSILAELNSREYSTSFTNARWESRMGCTTCSSCFTTQIACC